MRDEFLDKAIDQVARELADGAPRHGFAARVRERIEARAQVTRWPWLLAAATTAAALVVWLALPTRTVTPVYSPIARSANRVLLPPPLEDALPRVAAPNHRESAARPTRRKLPDIRIPIRMEDAPQIAAMPDLAELALPEIGIAALNVPSLEPDKESR